MTDQDRQMIAKLKAEGLDVGALLARTDTSGAGPPDEAGQSDLSDHEWELLSKLIPAKFMNRPRADERYRRLFDGLIWLKQSRAAETCLPERYGTNPSIRKLREAMALRGDFSNILIALPTLGLDQRRTALLAKICDDAHRRGEHILSMRRRGATALLH